MMFRQYGEDGCAGEYVCLRVTYRDQQRKEKVMEGVYDINITFPFALQDLCSKEQLDLDSYEILNEMGEEERLDDSTVLHMLTYKEDETVTVDGFDEPLDIILIKLKPLYGLAKL
jgi:hypothetical protein